MITEEPTTKRIKFHICMDLEMSELTPAEMGMIYLRNEVIQIGAVMLDEDFRLISVFNKFVKPKYSHITEFINNLTGISEDDLKDAVDFETAFSSYVEWIEEKTGNEKFITYCWSVKDHTQIHEELMVKAKERDDLLKNLETFVDLQRTFGEVLGTHSSIGLGTAVHYCHESFEGKEHSALADAFNTAVILNKLCRASSFSPQFHMLHESKEASIEKERIEDEKLNKSMSSSFASFLKPDQLKKLGIDRAKQEEIEHKRMAETKDDYSNYLPPKMSKREKKLLKLHQQERKKRMKFSPEIQSQIANHHPTLKYNIPPIDWLHFYTKMLTFKSDIGDLKGMEETGSSLYQKEIK